MNIPESRGQNFANLQTLANQPRSLGTPDPFIRVREKEKQLERLHAELEITYDRR
jgi:hypothetical protein